MFRIEREVYSFLDWLGDVGGLKDALFMIGVFILFIHVVIRGNRLEAWLIESYFRKPSVNEKEKGDASLQAKIDQIKERIPYKLTNRCCYCLRSIKEKRIIDKGIDRTFNELEVDQFIRQQKQMRVAMKVLFTKLELYLLRNHQMFMLNSSSDGSDLHHEDEYDENPEDLRIGTEQSSHLDSLIAGALDRPGRNGETVKDGQNAKNSKRTSIMHQIMALKALSKNKRKSQV